MKKKKKIMILIIAAVLILIAILIICMSCSKGCNHQFTMVEAVESTCTEDGHDTYYVCEECGKLFLDENGTEEITEGDVFVESPGHDMKHHAAVNPTFTKEGRKQYWECNNCGMCFLDAIGRNEVSKLDLIVAVLDGNLVDGDSEDESGEIQTTLLKTGVVNVLESIEAATKVVVVGNAKLTKVYRDGAEISFSVTSSDAELYEILSVTYNGQLVEAKNGVYQIIYDADNPNIYIELEREQSDTTIVLPAIPVDEK